jgi:hypothetical protein
MKIEVVDATSEHREITLKATGDVRKVYNQNVYIWKDNEKYPIKSRIPLENSSPYPVGMYALSDGAFEVGQYGDLQINRYEIRLIPLPATVEKPLSFAK